MVHDAPAPIPPPPPGVPFFRLSGAGNDFLALAEPAADPTAEEIRAWCSRGRSLGADGLFILRRDGGGVAMEYFNADGLASELCLNGTRCAARLAFHLGWARDEVRIATGSGPVPAQSAGPARVALGLPPLAEPPRELTVELEGRLWEGWRVVVGVPHFVVPWGGEGLATAPVAAVGPLLRRHPAFGAAGANVDFVRYPSAGRLEIRSYERGVEGETLACGTGMIAAAAVGLLTRRSELPLQVLTRGGFELEVGGEPGEGRLPRGWSLTGDARLVAAGTLTPEAASLPSPPEW
jgi:diaminopimelate epimerase